MTKYTIENLKEVNQVYDYHHRVTISDVEKANKWVELIENSRTVDRPQIGDIVEFTNKHGDYYRNAHIEKIDNEDNTMEICEHPSIPFVGYIEEENRIYTSTSGGAWNNIPSKLKLIGQREKVFKVWGHCGLCANGAVSFTAMVNVWEYIEDDTLEFTTKTHDKKYWSIRKELNSTDRYKYTANGEAYEDDKMFSAYLQTFKGVVKKGHWENQLIVWTYKEEKIHCKTIEEYNSIDGINDTWLCNGIRECKRIYDDKNYKVITYIPPYEELYKEQFGLDWRTHSHLEYALNNPIEEYDINKILQEAKFVS